MPKQLQLNIPTPCHENWDKMTTVEKGKFCGSCQKQVIDFTAMSDRELALFFKKPSTGSVCGRFMSDQLDRSIEIPKKRVPWVKYFFQIALPAFFVSKVSAQNIDRKWEAKPVADTSNRIVTTQLRTLGMVLPTSIKPAEEKPVVPVVVKKDTARLISGAVVDVTGNAIPGASIVLKGANRGVAADANGNFRIIAKSGDCLIVSAAGFESKDVFVSESNNCNIVIAPNNLIGGEVVIVAGGVSVKRTKKTIPLIKDISMQPVLHSFKFYPNPVVAGSSITIDWKVESEGYHVMQLVNLAGQAVYQKEIWIDADARLLQLDIPSVTAGNYLLSIANKINGKKYTEKISIQ